MIATARPKKRAIYKAKYPKAATAFTTIFTSVTRAGTSRLPDLRPSRRTLISEENYFFRLSASTSKSCSTGTSRNPTWVQPDFRMNEVRSFVEAGLKDVSSHQPQDHQVGRYPWPDDPEHVFYVWYDALTSYMTAIGYGAGEGGDFDPRFKRLWPADLHMMGKEGNHPLPTCPSALARVPHGCRSAIAAQDLRARLAAFRAGKDEQVQGQRGLSGADRQNSRQTTRCDYYLPTREQSSARTAISPAARLPLSRVTRPTSSAAWAISRAAYSR